jgi:hypothetical protein
VVSAVTCPLVPSAALCLGARASLGIPNSNIRRVVLGDVVWCTVCDVWCVLRAAWFAVCGV